MTYDEGLSRYHGLLDLAEKYGILKKVSTRYELPDGTKIMKEPEKYFTDDVMDALEVAANTEFTYGRGNDAELSTSNSEEQTEG